MFFFKFTQDFLLSRVSHGHNTSIYIKEDSPI